MEHSDWHNWHSGPLLRWLSVRVYIEDKVANETSSTALEHMLSTLEYGPLQVPPR